MRRKEEVENARDSPMATHGDRQKKSYRVFRDAEEDSYENNIPYVLEVKI